MNTKQKFPVNWFRGSMIAGLLVSSFAIGAMIYEFVVNDNLNVQSLNQHLGYGLLLIYFSGRPMADERIRFLKYKAMVFGFLISFILVTVINYLITYPDGLQTGAISSYLFALMCIITSFICFYILKSRD